MQVRCILVVLLCLLNGQIDERCRPIDERLFGFGLRLEYLEPVVRQEWCNLGEVVAVQLLEALGDRSVELLALEKQHATVGNLCVIVIIVITHSVWIEGHHSDATASCTQYLLDDIIAEHVVALDGIAREARLLEQESLHQQTSHMNLELLALLLDRVDKAQHVLGELESDHTRWLSESLLVDRAQERARE